MALEANLEALLARFATGDNGAPDTVSQSERADTGESRQKLTYGLFQVKARRWAGHSNRSAGPMNGV